MRKKNRPKVVSLFVGCGGLDYGFKQEGFDLVYSCDNDPAAIKVYTRNVDSRGYVRDVTSEEFHSDIRNIGSCDVVIGGFPCQGFSKAGPKNESDNRNLLYKEMKKAIEELQPEIFLAENVDGLSQNFKGKFLLEIVSDFASIGYKVEYRIVDAVGYGVPQHRRRIFFIGTKQGRDFFWPNPTHFSLSRNGEFALNKNSHLQDNLFDSKLSLPVTVRDAIWELRDINVKVPDHRVTKSWRADDLEVFKAIKPGQKLCNVRFSDTSVYTWQIPSVFGAVDAEDIVVLETIGKNRRHKKYGSIPNGNPLSYEVIVELSGLKSIKRRLNKLVKQGYLKEKEGGYDLTGAMFCSGLYKRPEWDLPSPTILTIFDNPRYFLHPDQNRPFSLRECARLQGFPDDFVFTESENIKELRDGYRLVGNAVPPMLSTKFAISIKKYLKDGAKYEAA